MDCLDLFRSSTRVEMVRIWGTVDRAYCFEILCLGVFATIGMDRVGVQCLSNECDECDKLARSIRVMIQSFKDEKRLCQRSLVGLRARVI